MQFGGKNGHSSLTALCRKGICKNFAVHTLQKSTASRIWYERGYAGCRNKLLCNVSLLEYSTADISKSVEFLWPPGGVVGCAWKFSVWDIGMCVVSL